jgi:hypothetical protein
MDFINKLSGPSMNGGEDRYGLTRGSTAPKKAPRTVFGAAVGTAFGCRWLGGTPELQTPR